jgi:hypothetical protein
MEIQKEGKRCCEDVSYIRALETHFKGGRMRRTVVTVVALLGLTASVATAGDLNDKYFVTLSGYHGVSYEEVFAIADDVGVNDVAAAYAIAERSDVSIDKVVELRSSNQNWATVAKNCGLGGTDFYIMISGRFSSKTYSPIFEKFNAAPASTWGDLVLTDDEIVNLTNLRFISSHHDYSMFDIIAMKDIGSDWPRINQKVTSAKEAKLRKYAKR